MAGEVGEQTSPYDVSDEELLNEALGGRPGAPRPFVDSSMDGGGVPNTPLGTTTPMRDSVMATRALPTVPEMNPGYDAAVARRAQLQQPLDRSKYQLGTGRKIATALSGFAMGIGGARPEEVMKTVRGNLDSPYNEAFADREHQLEGNATEIGGYKEDYSTAVGKYNMQMKELETQNNMTKAHNTFGGAVQEEKDPTTGQTKYYKISEDGTKIEVPRPKREAPPTFAQGLQDPDTDVRTRAEKGFRTEKQIEFDLSQKRIKGGGKGTAPKFGKIEETKKNALTELDQSLNGKKETLARGIGAASYSALNPTMKKQIDKQIEQERIAGQRKIEQGYGKSVVKAGGHYTPMEYPNWAQQTAQTLGGAQTTPTGSKSSQVTGKPATPTTGGAPGGTVRVIAPDGRHGTIPAAKLKEKLAQGYKQE